jgi:hypothetical protein
VDPTEEDQGLQGLAAQLLASRYQANGRLLARMIGKIVVFRKIGVFQGGVHVGEYNDKGRLCSINGFCEQSLVARGVYRNDVMLLSSPTQLAVAI